MKQQSKFVAYSIALCIVIVGAFLLTLSLASNTPGGATVSSAHKTITLTRAQERVQQNTTIEGTVDGGQQTRLFYAIEGIGSMGMIDGGAIRTDSSGRFTHPITLPDTLKSGSALELTLYTRSNSGTIIDQLTTPIIYSHNK